MIRMKKSVKVALAGTSVLAAALAGCSSSSPAAGKSGSSSLILNLYTGASGAFVNNWNPFSPTEVSGVRGMIYEPLFYYNNLAAGAPKPAPLLGKDYSWNADGTKLTVTVQDGIKWNDGQPFTANDVAYTFNLISKTPALNTSGNSPTATATGSTVVISFPKASFVDGPNFLGHTMIVPQHIWQNIKDPATAANSNPVGTGPLKEGSFTPQSYLMVKNPLFRDAKDVQVGGARYYSLSGNEAGTQKLLAGQLDWSGIFIPDMKKVLATKPTLGWGVTTDAQVVLTACANAAWGCTGPQTDVAVRQAISAALDRTQINHLANYDTGNQISSTFALIGRDNGYIAPGLNDKLPMTPDVAKAKSLLEGAGWKLGPKGYYEKNGKTLTLTASVVSGWTNYIVTLDTVKQQLKAAGIELIPQQQAYSEVNNNVGLGKFQLTISSLWQGPAPDPYYVYANFFDSSSATKVGKSMSPYSDVARFNSPVVQAALKKASGTEDTAQKAAAYAAIQKVIVPDIPYIPVLNTVGAAEFSTARVTGFPDHNNQWASTDPNNEVSQAQVLLHLRPVKK